MSTSIFKNSIVSRTHLTHLSAPLFLYVIPKRSMFGGKKPLETIAKEGLKATDSALAASQVPSSPVPNIPPHSSPNSNSGNISAPNQPLHNTSTPVSLPKVSSPKYQESIASKFGTSPEDHVNKSVDESTHLPPFLSYTVQVTSTVGQDMKQNAAHDALQQIRSWETYQSTFDEDLNVIKTQKENEYSLSVIKLSPDLRDGINKPIPPHEVTHATVLKEDHETGSRTYSLILTSSANNSVDKTPTTEIDGLNKDGIQKPQRIAYLQNKRMLDVDVKQDVDYTIDKAATAYIHQEHIFDKIDEAIKDRENSPTIIRRSADSSVMYNESGQEKENENINTDFIEKSNETNKDIT